MPEGEQEFEGEGGNDGGKGEGGGVITPGGEAIAMASAALDDLPSGACAETAKYLHEQWLAERERAERAERATDDLRARLAEAEALLAQSREALDAAERRRRIDQMLLEQEAADLETARLLTEAAVAQMPDRDVADVIADLRRRKPFLFNRSGPTGGSSATGGLPASAVRSGFGATGGLPASAVRSGFGATGGLPASAVRSGFGATGGSSASAAMAPHVPPTDPAAQAAKDAVRTGDRRDLLRYLRARRGA